MKDYKKMFSKSEIISINNPLLQVWETRSYNKDNTPFTAFRKIQSNLPNLGYKKK